MLIKVYCREQCFNNEYKSRDNTMLGDYIEYQVYNTQWITIWNYKLYKKYKAEIEKPVQSTKCNVEYHREFESILFMHLLSLGLNKACLCETLHVMHCWIRDTPHAYEEPKNIAFMFANKNCFQIEWVVLKSKQTCFQNYNNLSTTYCGPTVFCIKALFWTLKAIFMHMLP